jgi:pimeloyl-ACP methyl ester carboxylesterase
MEIKGRSSDGSQGYACQIVGPTWAHPIVFVHGSTLTRRSWQPQINALQDEFRILACDLPGHGARAGEPFTIEVALEQMHVSIEQLIADRVLLVGISLGGHLATLYASRFPDKIAGLVISGASMNFSGMVGLWTRLAGKVMLRMNEDRLRRKAEASIRRKWPAEISRLQIAAGIYPYGAARSFQELSRNKFQHELARIQAPVLILNGELDRPNRKGEQLFLRSAPNARLEIIPGAGHACNLEMPEAYTAILRRFATEIGRMGSKYIVDKNALDSRI